MQLSKIYLTLKYHACHVEIDIIGFAYETYIGRLIVCCKELQLSVVVVPLLRTPISG